MLWFWKRTTYLFSISLESKVNVRRMQTDFTCSWQRLKVSSPAPFSLMESSKRLTFSPLIHPRSVLFYLSLTFSAGGDVDILAWRRVGKPPPRPRPLLVQHRMRNACISLFPASSANYNSSTPWNHHAKKYSSVEANNALLEVCQEKACMVKYWNNLNSERQNKNC